MTLNDAIGFAVFWGIMELGGYFIFEMIRQKFHPDTSIPYNRTEALKGILERLTLYAGLMAGYEQILTLFGALKLANRLESEDKSDSGKNYFLIGNLASVLLVFIALYLHSNFGSIDFVAALTLQTR